MKISSTPFRLSKNKERPDPYWRLKAAALVVFAFGLLIFSLYTFGGIFKTEKPFVGLQKNLQRAETAYKNNDFSTAISKAYAARSFAITLGDTDSIVTAVLLEAKARLLLKETNEGTKLIEDVIAISERDQNTLFLAKAFAAITEVYAAQ